METRLRQFAPIDLWRGAQVVCACRARGNVLSLHASDCPTRATYRALMLQCNLPPEDSPDPQRRCAARVPDVA